MNEPLIVTAEMAGDLANAAPHLDSMLLYLACRRAGIAEITSADGVRPWVELPPIPLGRRSIGGEDVSLCSSPRLLLAHGREVVERFAKRIDATSAATLLAPAEQKQICTTGTWTKSYYLPLRKRPALFVRSGEPSRPSPCPSSRPRKQAQLPQSRGSPEG